MLKLKFHDKFQIKNFGFSKNIIDKKQTEF